MHGIAHLETKRLCLPTVRRPGFDPQDVPRRGLSGRSKVLVEPRAPPQSVVGGVRRDKHPGPAPAVNQALIGQMCKRTAHRVAVHAETQGKRGLGGQPVARAVVAVGDLGGDRS